MDAGAPSVAAPARRGARLHWPSVVVCVVGLAVTATLTVGAVSSINTKNDRQLSSDAHNVATVLQGGANDLQNSLINLDGIAALSGVDAFRANARANVGRQGPFSSISLWRRTDGRARLLAVVGARPQLLAHPGAAARALAAVRPSTELTVTGLLVGKVRGLGVAEMLPGPRNGPFVYAENVLPATTAGTPYQGLDFALYFGRSTAPSHLMVSSIRLPVTGPTSTTVVPFGSADVTILTALASRPPGTLPGQVPWGIGSVGVVLTIGATYVVERLVRRRELAERVATDRARETAAHRGISETLQHSLLPSGEPEFPGVEMAGRYVSGTMQLDVGGDWYDAIPLDAEHLFLAVGDVSGRGLRAATVMGSLRHAIRAYAVQGDDPAQVLRKLDELVDVGRDGCFATVLCVSIDVPRRRVRVASAGHLPALLIDAAGARYVDTPANTPVGVACPTPVRATTVTVAPDAALLLYTDGLVERRDQTIDDGLERLRSCAAGTGGSMVEVLDAVLGTLAPDGGTDDLAMLGLRWSPLPAARPPHDAATPAPGRAWQAIGHGATVRARRFANSPASAAAARAFAVEVLPDGAFDPDDVALLVSELATNAMVHASSDFEVIVVDHPPSGRVRIGVHDEGSGTPVRQGPAPLAPRGRGLRIVEELGARWGVEWDGDGGAKTVWFEARRRPESEAGTRVASPAAEA